MNTITWDDFIKIEMRSGTIIDVQDFPEARKPAYKVWIDFGEKIGIKKIKRSDHRSVFKRRVNRQTSNLCSKFS